MCGIIGINSNKPVSATIINSLKKEHIGKNNAFKKDDSIKRKI